MNRFLIQGLYLVTDRALCGQRTLEEVVSGALRGGVRCVQLREKDISTRLFVEEASRIKALTEAYGVPLIINDRIDVALAAGADGVHIGQEDMPYSIARELLGPSAIIGLSVESWEEVEYAQNLDVDYLGVSPIFETPTKIDTKGRWGIDGLSRIRDYSRHTLVAIGGLNSSNAADVIMAGADSVAVVSAVCKADDPFKETQNLCNIIRLAVQKRMSERTR